MKLPFKFMLAMLIIALGWFLIMFVYLDDLTDTKPTGRQTKDQVFRSIQSGFPTNDRHRDVQFHQVKDGLKFFIKNDYNVNDRQEEGADYIDDNDVVKYVLSDSDDGNEKYIAAPKYNRMFVNHAERVIHRVHTKRLTTEELNRRIKTNHGIYNGTMWKGESKIIEIIRNGDPVRRSNHTMKLMQTITVPNVILQKRKTINLEGLNADIASMVQQEEIDSGKRGLVPNGMVERRLDKQTYWSKQLDRARSGNGDAQMIRQHSGPADEGFSLDRQGILREINKKAHEIEKLNMNRTDDRNNHAEIRGSVGYRGGSNMVEFNGSVLPAPILPRSDSGSNKVLSHDFNVQKPLITDSGRLKHAEGRSIINRPQLDKNTDRLRHAIMAEMRKTSKRPSTRGAPLVQRELPKKLTLDRQRDLKDSRDRHSFNVSASDALPLNRHVPDTRPEACLNVAYNVTSLPTASIIISFHNEAWSTLLRTVHSVLNRTPMELLQEVILVDDNSTYDYLGREMERELKFMPKVQIIRTHSRFGLAKARTYGMKQAIGEVLVFLDSHCEVNHHWLEPLLASIVNNRNKVVSPLADIISHTTFDYSAGPDNLRGAFNWRLQFIWEHVPEAEINRGRLGLPIRTPAIGGGMLAVDKHYFFRIGGFDQGMNIWGSENLELSFRVWQCGGSLEILPCSRVGHVFRPIIPYGFPGGPRQVLHRNAMRVAEVWMDSYKALYYAVQPFPPDPEVLGSLESQREMRRRLKCHNFRWYLEHVFPEMDIPPKNALYFGQFQNSQSGWCLTYPPGRGTNEFIGNTCVEHKPFQVFTLTGQGELRHGNMCVNAIQKGLTLSLNICGQNNTSWVYTKDNHLRLLSLPEEPTSTSHLCLDLDHIHANKVILSKCDIKRLSQLWKFTYHFNLERLRGFIASKKRVHSKKVL